VRCGSGGVGGEGAGSGGARRLVRTRDDARSAWGERQVGARRASEEGTPDRALAFYHRLLMKLDGFCRRRGIRGGGIVGGGRPGSARRGDAHNEAKRVALKGTSGMNFRVAKYLLQKTQNG